MLNGKLCIPTQCNNMYIYPGVGLAAVVGKCSKITADMFYAATKTLASYQTRDELEKGDLFPKVSEIRTLSMHIACSVIEMARREGLVQNMTLPKDREDLLKHIEKEMWKPNYNTIINADI